MTLLKQLALTLKHFWPTLFWLGLGGVIIFYWGLETISAYIVAAFLSLVQSFIDKFRDIRRSQPVAANWSRTQSSGLGSALFERLMLLLGLLLALILVCAVIGFLLVWWRF